LGKVEVYVIRAFGSHRTGGWMGPSVGLEAVAKRKKSHHCPCRELNPSVFQPVNCPCSYLFIFENISEKMGILKLTLVFIEQ
jgi:ferredoxin-thioredoxin reductase catalytic subunit